MGSREDLGLRGSQADLTTTPTPQHSDKKKKKKVGLYSIQCHVAYFFPRLDFNWDKVNRTDVTTKECLFYSKCTIIIDTPSLHLHMCVIAGIWGGQRECSDSEETEGEPDDRSTSRCAFLPRTRDSSQRCHQRSIQSVKTLQRIPQSVCTLDLIKPTWYENQFRSIEFWRLD